MRRATVGDVEAILVEEWQAAGFNVYLRRRVAGRHELIVPGRGTGGTFVEAVELEAAEPPAPSLFLPEEALEAIVAAGAGIKPPTSSMADHLADTIVVRDRMLELVERIVSTEPRRPR